MSKNQEHIKALKMILHSNRLDVAKEIAAEALDLEVDEFLTQDRVTELDFSEINEEDQDYFDQDHWEDSYA